MRPRITSVGGAASRRADVRPEKTVAPPADVPGAVAARMESCTDVTRLWTMLAWLRTSLWMIPALMGGVAAIIAYVMLFSNLQIALAPLRDQWWVFSGDASTARDLLSTLLSGMITMTSLVVSITMVVLSLAAGQLGPRLIWTFIGDRQIQSVIGLFVATILYTLIVLRSIDSELGPDHVPHVAITLASVLVVVCLLALLFYIHKLARSIISDTMIDVVARNLEHAIEKSPEGRPPTIGGPLPSGVVERTLALDVSGYVQMIDYGGLCKLAARHDALLTVKIRAGHYVVRGRACIDVLAPTAPPETFDDAVREAFVLGADRTPDQDLEYAVRQLVEIALRALSPSMNDTFTAITVVDRLAGAIERLGRRAPPPAEYLDAGGTVRVIADVSTYNGLVDAAFIQIRQSAEDNPALLMQLARRLGDLVAVAGTAEQTAALTRHLEIVRRLVPEFDEPTDRHDLARVTVAALQQNEHDDDAEGRAGSHEPEADTIYDRRCPDPGPDRGPGSGRER